MMLLGYRPKFTREYRFENGRVRMLIQSFELLLYLGKAKIKDREYIMPDVRVEVKVGGA